MTEIYMKISKSGLVIIKQYEGFSANPYICPAGKITIGYGHTILTGEKFPSGGISDKIAESLLKQDVAIAERAINRLVIIKLLQNQFDALVSFVYNIGGKAFGKSTLLRLINENKQEMAAAEFSKWIFAGGVVQNGLIRRRTEEKSLFIGTLQ
jgi:lysozyme